MVPLHDHMFNNFKMILIDAWKQCKAYMIKLSWMNGHYFGNFWFLGGWEEKIIGTPDYWLCSSLIYLNTNKLSMDKLG